MRVIDNDIYSIKIRYGKTYDYWCVGDEFVIMIDVENNNSSYNVKITTGDYIKYNSYNKRHVRNIEIVYKKEKKQDGELSAL